MSTSKKELFNAALGKVTRKRISATTEPSNEAKVCNELWETVLDEVLAEHSWTDTTIIVKLVKLAEDPPHGFGNRFQLPTDYIRLIQAYYDSSRDSFDFEWEKRGKEFWTNEGTVYIKYVQQPAAPDSLGPALITCLIQRLAYRLAFALSIDGGREAELLKEYETLTLPRAKSIDSMESRYLEFEESPWIESMQRSSL